VSDAEILEKTEMRQLVYVTIFPFFTIFSPILAIFPRFNHFREEVLKRVLKPP